jgi:Na+/H+-dicarboxylate symporter
MARGDLGLGGEVVALQARQGVQVLGGVLEALVFLEAADELGAWVVLFGVLRAGAGRSMRDLISASMAAMTRYSAASSSRKPLIRST